jgi:Rod binding domain-containing protein
MSAPVVPISAQPVPTSASAQSAHETARLHKAAQEFESLLVKQLLQASKLGGDKSTGYADMAIDAMATGVEKAGGLGLARRIEETVARSLRHGEQRAAPAPGAGSGAAGVGVGSVGNVTNVQGRR